MDFGFGQPPLTPGPGYPSYGPIGFGGAFQNTVGRTPMFGGDPGPQYRSPFNLRTGTMLDPLMQIGAPFVMQSLFGQGATPLQFRPEQGFWEQMRATQFYNMSLQAQREASRRDISSMQSTLGGAQMMFTGQPLTDAARARNMQLAETITGMTPMLSQLMGPDLIDRLYGSKGSAAIMAQQLHIGMRGVRDPISGLTGYTGQSASMLTDTMYERIMENPETRARFKNMSAGQLGLMTQSMQARGLLGNSSAGMTLSEQISNLPRQLSDADVARLAMRHAGPDGDMAAASAQIRSSFSAIRGGGMSRDQISELAGGDDILRLADVDRIQGRLEKMSGAVRAMQDIIGPDGTMEEIFNALDAMTNGGFASMSSQQIETTVRRMNAVAQNTGIGVQGMMGLMAQNSEIGRRLGLDPQAAIDATMQGAAFGAASGEMFNVAGQYGAISQEQVTIRDMQLRMQAAGSPLSRNLGAFMRLVEGGDVKIREGTEAAAVEAAIRNGETHYEFNGQRKSLRTVMDQGLAEMMERDAGVGQATTREMLLDVVGTQEYERQFNTMGITRQLMPEEFARGGMGSVMGAGLRNIVAEGGGTAAIVQQLGGEAEYNKFLTETGILLAEDALAMSATDDPSRRQIMAENTRTRMIQQLEAKGMNKAEAAAMVDSMLANNELVGEMALASGNRAAGAVGMRTLTEAQQLFNPQAQAGMAGRLEEAAVAAYLGQVTSGIGREGPIARFSDLLQGADENTTWQDAIGKLLNVVNLEDIAKAQPTTAAGDTVRLMQAAAADPELMAAMSPALKGLIEGGDAARTAIAGLEGNMPDWANAQLMDNLRKAAEGDTVSSIIAGSGMLDADAVENLQDLGINAIHHAPGAVPGILGEDAAAGAAAGGGGIGGILSALFGGGAGGPAAAGGGAGNVKMTGTLTIHEDGTGTLDAVGTVVDHAAAQGI